MRHTSARNVDVTFPDGHVESLMMVVSHSESDCRGFWDADRHLWVEEIHHRDGRVERFLSRSIFGERFEDNP